MQARVISLDDTMVSCHAPAAASQHRRQLAEWITIEVDVAGNPCERPGSSFHLRFAISFPNIYHTNGIGNDPWVVGQLKRLHDYEFGNKNVGLCRRDGRYG